MSYLKTAKKLKELANSENQAVEKMAKDFWHDGVSASKISEFMVEASKNPAWTQEFNAALNLTGENKVAKYSESDIRAQFSIMGTVKDGKQVEFSKLSVEEQDGLVKSYATTGSDTTGTNVAIDGILPTNILDVDQYLFNNDNSLVSEFTLITADGQTQMPEFDVFPTSSRVAEAATTPLVEFTRRDGTDYFLNPNIKLQVTTSINELALRKGTAAYFAVLKEAMVRELGNDIVKQAINGTNGSNQFHGFLQTVVPATIANKRGSFDVTADTTIAAESNKFRKLVLMLATLPSNISAQEMQEYSWVMTRNTFYGSIVPALDGFSRYYDDSIMKGVPNLMGPGGLPIKLVSTSALANGTVLLVPLKKYFLAMPDGIQLLDDGGISNFNAGQTLVKAFCFADGGYARNFMRTSGYTTGADDNRDRNLYRFITGI